MMRDLSILPKEGQKRRFSLLAYRTNAPGKGRAYGEYIRNDLLPAMKKTDGKGFIVYRLVLGGSPRDWVVAQPFEKWAVFDTPTPLNKALGAEKAYELAMKGANMIVAAKRVVTRYRPELSSGE